VSVDPGRTEAIRNSPSPRDVKGIARFIGIVNFSHKFIPRFAERAGPLNDLPLLEFCSRDATTVRNTYTYGGGNRELVVSSAYLPYYSDEPPPSKEVKDIIEYCHSRKKQLIIGCDANAHHTLWGSTGVNPSSGEFEPVYSKLWQ
jgi:hypothetical protein